MLLYGVYKLIYSNYMSTKIQNLLLNWLPGIVRTVSALKKQGYSQDLLNRYRYSGWLNSIGEGALIKAGDTPTLFGAIYALQQDLNLNVHLGGLSSLEVLGYAHYLKAKQKNIWLFGENKRLPRWFANYKWESKIRYTSTNLFKKDSGLGLTVFKDRTTPIILSDETRAMLEYLSHVPEEHSLEQGKDIMLGLTSLPPVLVNKMLINCTSIKVKRLFLLLAEECGHSWLKKIQFDKIDLGSGPRNLTPGGVFSKKYLISVPASILSRV
jgi:Transcriptional regulator, AbiEi antitoxin, Type IV TA system/Transcriptional regulator, AbiEi antitoxin N-terminal domain